MPPKTKAATAKFLIGQPSSVLATAWQEALTAGNMTLCNSPLLPFKGKARLPTKEETLLLYFAIREVDKFKNSPEQTVIDMVAEQIVKYWKMAPVQTVAMTTIRSRIVCLLRKYRTRLKCRKSHEQTKTGKEEKNRKEYTESLAKLFDIAALDAEKQIEKNRFLVKKTPEGKVDMSDREDDLHFLLDQRGPRIGWMSGMDEVYWERSKGSETRKRKQLEGEKENREMREEAAKKPKIAVDDIDDEEGMDEDFKTPETVKKRKEKKSETITVEFQRNPWKNPETTAMMDRLKLTPSQSMGFFSSLIKTSTINDNSTDLSEFTCSVSSIYRSRNKNRSILFELAQEEFSANMPKHNNLHWDGKMLANLQGEMEDYEAILVSGSPSYIEGKLLAVSKLPSSSGEEQFNAVKEQVVLWSLKDSIRSFTYDTTSSNTGCEKGCCKRLEEWLGRPLLWFGCRHHFPELMAKASWYAVFEADLKPTVSFFEDIKNRWDEIDKDKPTMKLSGDLFNKDEAVQFYREILSKKNKRNELILRDDYRELVEVSLSVLGGVSPDFTWKKPGPCHKARFMAFGIYIMKAVAFSDQLELEQDVMESLVRVATFISTLYVPYFITASIGCDAPANDLEMFRKLLEFSKTDPVIGEAALAILTRHTWYLQEEVVPFALFSSKLNMDDKSRLAAKILTFEKEKPAHWDSKEQPDTEHEQYLLGKPIMELTLTPATQLVDLVGSNSFLLWDILGLDWDWLKLDPAKWVESSSFLEMEEYVKTVKVTNDCAERGVKVY